MSEGWVSETEVREAGAAGACGTPCSTVRLVIFQVGGIYFPYNIL